MTNTRTRRITIIIGLYDPCSVIKRSTTIHWQYSSIIFLYSMWTTTTNCLLFFREGSALHAWTAPATSQPSWRPVYSSSHCHHGTCLHSGTKKALLGCPKHRRTLTATSSSATTSLSNILIYSWSEITVLILYISIKYIIMWVNVVFAVLIVVNHKRKV